ncbi:hypothetical protein JTB14_000674 [Gonioctena quinquepunctata]|nr:hypothetical protein JTB14_000674 [Gonioctena quinquepunctata]
MRDLIKFLPLHQRAKLRAPENILPLRGIVVVFPVEIFGLSEKICKPKEGELRTAHKVQRSCQDWAGERTEIGTVCHSGWVRFNTVGISVTLKKCNMKPYL